MRQPIATFCSLTLVLWGYQTGLWGFAIPMAIAIEGREFIRRRWPISWGVLQGLYILAGLLWLCSVIFLSPSSPTPLAYAARYQLLRGLPIALFPLILAQTYGLNVGAMHHNLVRRLSHPTSQFSLYYPYFGVCLLAASATGGHAYGFLAVSLLLVAGVLWVTRSPRFSSTTFYGLILLAMIMSLGGAHQFYWLEANLQLPSLPRLRDWIDPITVLWGRDPVRGPGPLIHDFDERLPSFESFEDSAPPTSRADKRDERESERLSEANDSESMSDEVSGSPSRSDSSGELNSGGLKGEAQIAIAQSDAQTLEGLSEAEVEQLAEENAFADETHRDGTGYLESAALPSTPSEVSSNTNSTSGPAQSVPSLPTGIQQIGGLVDPQQSQTRIGALGSLQQSNAILFWVKPLQANRQPWPHPLRIREATYNSYQSGVWNAVNSTFQSQPKRGNQHWKFGSHSGDLSIQISEVLTPKNGLLKLPLGVSEVKALDVQSVALNQYGAVSFERQAQATHPLTYEAQFDPAISWDIRPIRQDKAIPKQEQKAVKAVLKTLNVRGKSDSEKVNTIAAFFDQGFQYSLKLPPTPQGKTPIAAFLLDHHQGHCEYFASATSFLLRSVGIPARYVVGYSVSEYDPEEQQYLVRVRDAHAWVMAYVNGNWITVDTTPSNGASQDRNGQTTVEEQIAQRSPAIHPENFSADHRSASSEPSSRAGSDWMEATRRNWTGFWNWITDWVSKFSESMYFGAFLGLGISIVLGTAVLIWRLYRQPPARRRWYKRRHAQASPGAEPEEMGFTFEDIENQLQSVSLQRSASETPMQWVKRLEEELSAAQFRGLKEILDLHYRYRFDPAGLDGSDRQRLADLIENWLVDFGARRVKSSSVLRH